MRYNRGKSISYQRHSQTNFHPADHVRIKKVLEMIGSKNKVLDIGCDNGTIGSLIRKKGNEVYGVDLSVDAIKFAKEKEIQVLVADMKSIFPFLENSFDVVFAGEIIEHIYDTDQFLDEVKRVLRPYGHLVLTTPNLASLGRRVLLLLGKNPIIEVSPVISPVGKSVGHIRYFVKESITKLLRSHGFNVDRIVSDAVNFDYSGRSGISLAKIFPTLGKSLIIKATLKNR